MSDEVGVGTWPMRLSIPIPHDNKGPGIGGLHNRYHPKPKKPSNLPRKCPKGSQAHGSYTSPAYRRFLVFERRRIIQLPGTGSRHNSHYLGRFDARAGDHSKLQGVKQQSRV
ncbi:hypothetical protein ACFX15_018069 [Malus domestica]